MFHRTRRLFLRPAFPEDWQALYAGIADHGVVRNLARAPWPYTKDDARAWAARAQDDRLPAFIVTAPTGDGERLVGSAGLGLAEDGQVQCGYWIARPFWGRGYATEALSGVIEVARTLGHERVVGAHFLDNPASGRVLEKAGFAPTGRITSCYSCGRGEEAPLREYAIDLRGGATCGGPQPVAA